MSVAGMKRLFDGEASVKLYRSEADKPAWAKDLDEKGFAVIPGILSPEECAHSFNGIKANFARMGVDILSEKSKNYITTHGIVQHYQVGHWQPVWDVRLNQKVQDIYAAIYGTRKLLTSFDGLCVKRPTDRDTGKSWWHTDQAAGKVGNHCVQGYVNLTDATDPRTGALYVIPGGHKKMEAFYEAFPDMVGTKDWVKFKCDEHFDFFDTKPVQVCAPAGSMVLWWSNLPHMSLKEKTEKGDVPPPPRCVVYVSSQPAEWCSARNLKAKVKYFQEKRMTSHWAASSVTPFEKKPWDRSGKLPILPMVEDRVESQRMLELAGVVPTTSQQPWLEPPLFQFNVVVPPKK